MIKIRGHVHIKVMQVAAKFRQVSSVRCHPVGVDTHMCMRSRMSVEDSQRMRYTLPLASSVQIYVGIILQPLMVVRRP